MPATVIPVERALGRRARRAVGGIGRTPRSSGYK
jgi:hypothetical protein